MAMSRRQRSSLAQGDAEASSTSRSGSRSDGDREAAAGTTMPASTRHPFRASLPVASPHRSSSSVLHVVQDYTKRSSRASLPAQFVPPGYWDFHMDLPRMQKVRQNSLASSTDRSSIDSRYESRSLSYGSPGTSTRTSIDSAYARSFRPDVPSRAASWNGAYPGAPGEFTIPTTLLRPQRLTGPASPRLRNAPGDAFKKLPREILMVILEQLQSLHLEGRLRTETCATCWMRDLCHLSMVCRKWANAARPKLYESIWLVGSDSMAHVKKKFKMKIGCRLKLLRRTLRANTMLAKYVKDLKVPDVLNTNMTGIERGAYLDTIASVVMACSNLERLLGLYPSHNHEFSRLIHALSTRANLREHVWNISASPYQRQYRLPDNTSPSTYNVVPGALHPDEYTDFLYRHMNWSNLTTIVLHCNPGGTINASLLSQTISHLPKLTDLALSAIPALPTNFFASLPPLKSLYLANISGLRPHDFSTFSTSSSARTLVNLTLIDVNLTSLPVLARLLSKLDSLRKFCLKQDTSPSVPIGTSIFLHPYLASASLRFLTWDILIPNEDDFNNDATRVLAKAIRAGGFPALRTLKAPCDYDGVLQSLCRPVERITSIYESGMWKGAANTLIDLIDERRKDSGVEVSDSGYGSTSTYGHEYSRSLKAARQAGQSRIDASRTRPKIQIIAEDWTDADKGVVNLTARFEFGGYIGMVSSRIWYCLEGDVDGKDEMGIAVEDLVHSGESRYEPRTGTCDGRWNLRPPEGGKLWEHKERARWRPLPVSRLF